MADAASIFGCRKQFGNRPFLLISTYGACGSVLCCIVIICRDWLQRLCAYSVHITVILYEAVVVFVGDLLACKDKICGSLEGGGG